MRGSSSFLELLRADGIVAGGGAHDAFSARLMERAGFSLIYVTGFGMCASLLGLPDMGLMDRSDFLETLTRIRRVTSRPMLVDTESGYGNDGAQIYWTFSELARIGVDAAHIEDLKDPLKYREEVRRRQAGSIRSSQDVAEEETLFTEGEMAERIAAALAGAQGSTAVVARCDGARFGVPRTIDRLRAYAAAGADAAMVAEPYALADLELIARSVPLPLLCCIGVRQDLEAHTYTLDQLAEGGIRGALFTATAFFAAAKAMREVAQLMRGQGGLSVKDMKAHLAPFEDVNDILDADSWYARAEGSG